MRPRLLAKGAAGLAVLLGGAAMWSVANAGSPDTGAFDAQPDTPNPNCLVHQKVKPSEKYTGGAKADTGKVLRVLRYYTANGNKGYCDGKAATGVDQAWAKMYVDLGADPAKVQGITGTG